MSTAASKSASVLSINEVVADLENALVKMKLLMKIEMATKTTTNIVNDATLLEINAKKSELRAFELTLEADRAEFEAAKAKLEDEKSNLRYAETQQKIAQSRMEDAISKLEAAQAQLEEVRRELDRARAHLEAAKSQTLINNTRLEAAKASLEASKIRFEAATNDLKDAKSKFEDAKTQLLEASYSIPRLEESEKNELRIQINQAESYVKEYKAKNQQLEAEILNLKRMNEEESNKSQVELKKVKDDYVSKLEDYKTESEVALKECRARSERLETEKSKLMNDKERLENELKEISDQSRRVRFAGVKEGNPVVFFDMKYRGAPIGRIVMELYADTNPRLAEIFRALCVGEKALPGTDRGVSYKGTDILYVVSGDYIQGGNLRVQNRAEFESIYGPISAAEMSNSKANGPGELYLVIQYHELGKLTCSFFINGSNGRRYNAPYPLIGKVIQGLDTVDARNHHYNIPNNIWLNEGEFVIADCGQL